MGAEPQRASPRDTAVATYGDSVPDHGHLNEPHVQHKQSRHEAPLVDVVCATTTVGLLHHAHLHPICRAHALHRAMVVGWEDRGWGERACEDREKDARSTEG